MKTLLADDSPIIRQFMGQALADIAAIQVVDHAATVPAAIQAVRDHQPKLAIVDYHMPGGSGLDVLTFIKNHTPTTIVILWSAGLSAPLHRRCRQAGADYVFDKATDALTLIATVRQLAQSHATSSSPNRGPTNQPIPVATRRNRKTKRTHAGKKQDSNR